MTKRPDKIHLAHKPSFFDSLEGNAIAYITKQAKSQLIARKHIIVQAGERATHLYLLKSGKVKYYRITKSGDELTLRFLMPGDVFGLGTFLENPSANIGNAEAISDCEVLVWKHKTVRTLANRFPRLGENALRIAIEYLTKYADRHTGLITKTAEQRLATVVLSLARNSTRVRSNGVEVNATNEHLGGLADTSHFNVSRILSRWNREGTVRKERGAVVVQVPEALPVD